MSPPIFHSTQVVDMPQHRGEGLPPGQWKYSGKDWVQVSCPECGTLHARSKETIGSRAMFSHECLSSFCTFKRDLRLLDYGLKGGV